MWRYPLRRLAPVFSAAALAGGAALLAGSLPAVGALLLVGAVALLVFSAGRADWRMRPGDARRSEQERLERFIREHSPPPGGECED